MLLRPSHFPGKSTGVGCHCLLHNFIEYWQMYAKIIDQFIFLPLVLEVPFPTPCPLTMVFSTFLILAYLIDTKQYFIVTFTHSPY